MKWLSKAKVYVQASVHEGFGCSVAEAMLCECVPVVSVDLPELRSFESIISIAKDREGFGLAVSSALQDDFTEIIAKRVEIAQENRLEKGAKKKIEILFSYNGWKRVLNET